MKRLHLQAGDTLVEVMIAIAIISSVISMSYATASRALRVGQQAQDRTEALKLVESQIETLKASAGTLPAPVPTIFTVKEATDPDAESFCFNSGTNIIKNGRVPDQDFNLDAFTANSSSGAAFVAGQVYDFSCAQGVGRRYKLSITRTDVTAGAAPTQSTFTIKARWERLGGGRDETVMYYKLHAGIF